MALLEVYNILSYHFVRGMISRGFISLAHTTSDRNIADVVSKNWPEIHFKPLIKIVLRHNDDVSELSIDDVLPDCNLEDMLVYMYEDKNSQYINQEST